jgi:lipopolysaccharide/colanic/teichoic acid biosynthesis glycosyltransferase
MDELPQLFNIFLGHMSFVGPRPHPDYEVCEYKEWYNRRLEVKPGLTGWSKLNLRLTPQNYEESIMYDIWYVDHWSLWMDMKIIMKTIPFVLSMEDAH